MAFKMANLQPFWFSFPIIDCQHSPTECIRIVLISVLSVGWCYECNDDQLLQTAKTGHGSWSAPLWVLRPCSASLMVRKSIRPVLNHHTGDLCASSFELFTAGQCQCGKWLVRRACLLMLLGGSGSSSGSLQLPQDTTTDHVPLLLGSCDRQPIISGHSSTSSQPVSTSTHPALPVSTDGQSLKHYWYMDWPCSQAWELSPWHYRREIVGHGYSRSCSL